MFILLLHKSRMTLQNLFISKVVVGGETDLVDIPPEMIWGELSGVWAVEVEDLCCDHVLIVEQLREVGRMLEGLMSPFMSLGGEWISGSFGRRVFCRWIGELKETLRLWERGDGFEDEVVPPKVVICCKVEVLGEGIIVDSVADVNKWLLLEIFSIKWSTILLLVSVEFEVVGDLEIP